MKFIFYYVFLRWFFNIIFRAQQDPIERLFVSIEGDFSNLLDAASEGVDQASGKLEELDDAGQRTGGSLKGSAAIAGAAFGLAAGAAGKLLDIVLRLAIAIPQMLANLGKQAVATNAQFETFATQFQTLLGSAGAAQQRLEELARFGVETPFELPEVVEASRTLQVFGGTALATGDNLRLIGDIAAGVNQPFQSVAFWIGRMYDALQNGQPFGEAALRLQEMGALSGDTRREMERLQKAGENGNEIFTVFSEQVGGKFSGNMERLSKTFQGVTSNLADFRENLLRVAGQPFFDEIRESAIAFLGILDENQDVIIEVAKGIGELAASVIRLGREGLEGLDIRGFLEGLGGFIERLTSGVKAGEAFVIMVGKFAKALLGPGVAALGAILGFVERLILSIPILGDALEFLRGMWSRLDEALITAAQVLAFAEAGAKGLTATLMPLVELVKLLGEALIALISGDFVTASQKANQALQRIEDGLIDIDAGAQAAAESFRESAALINDLIAPVEDVKEAIEDVGDAVEDAAQTEENVIAGMLDKLTNQMLGAVERRNEQLAKLESDHAEKVLDIMSDANKKRLDIEKKFSDGLADLAEDTEEKRLEIIAKTREDLAKLATDTDKELSQRRKEFNRDELRETEDHLREMRRLEEDFLLNLEDAVRERDARAIVDLERRFQLESARKEEDFQTDQSRGQEDFNDELAQIRDNEAERRQEILNAQAKALEDLRIHEEEKRLELEDRRREDLEKLQENLNERLMKEQQNYLERQASLEQALQKQLEALAQNLADEKGVTEEGAREILEIFNEYFGIGGNIDQVMEQFSRRRRIRADIQVEFEALSNFGAGGGGGIGGATGGGGPLSGLVPMQSFQHGGSMIATKPTVAMFGEVPELATFTPLSQLANIGDKPQKLQIEFSGSAPPGIGAEERDMIASTLLSALRDAGALAEG